MPHLSPMNWLLALMLFWSTMFIISAKLWWSNTSIMPFKLPIKSHTLNKTSQWKW